MIEQFCGKFLNVDIPSESQIAAIVYNYPMAMQYLGTASGLRSMSTPCLLGNLVYFFSGNSSMDQVTVYYDIDANTWTTLTVGATKPTARRGHGAGIINNVLYVTHGYDSGASAVQTTYALDLGTNTWTNKNPSSKPSIRYMVNNSTVVYNGKLYMFGGYSGSAWLQDAYAYDPVGNTWATLAAPTYACPASAVALHGDYIYLVCGGLTVTNYLLRYDIAGDSWTTLAPCPNKGYYFSLTECDGYLHLLGGYMYRNGVSNAATTAANRDVWWTYDIAQDRWYAKPQLHWQHDYYRTDGYYQYQWYYHTSISYKSKLYIFYPYIGEYVSAKFVIPNPMQKRYIVVEEERGF